MGPKQPPSGLGHFLREPPNCLAFVSTNNDATPGEGATSPEEQQDAETYTLTNGVCLPVIHTDEPTIVSKFSTWFAKPGQASVGRRIKSITDLNVFFGSVINGMFNTAFFSKCDFQDATFDAECSFDKADLTKVKDLHLAQLPDGWLEALLKAGLVNDSMMWPHHIDEMVAERDDTFAAPEFIRVDEETSPV